MRALIIVDVQYDFCPGGALAVAEGDAILPVIRQLADRFDVVVATQDWHPSDHGSFAANHGKEPGDVIDLDGLEQTLWPVHCVQGTRGAELHEELPTASIRRVFQKGADPRVDSYSGFFDNGRRASTGLGEYLREAGVDEVYIVGLATDYCVKFTALDARGLDFSTHVVEDACRGVELSPGDVTRAFDEMAQAGVGIVRSDDLLR